MTSEEAAVRLQNVFWGTAETLLFCHTNPWELDEALTAWGYGVGPCEAQDHIGLDRVLQRVSATPILTRMVAEGRLGKIGGVGYYRYPGGGGAVVDPLIEDLITEEAWFSKKTRRDLDDSELVACMNKALKRAWLAIVDEGGASSADVRETLANAVHFPKHKTL